MAKQRNPPVYMTPLRRSPRFLNHGSEQHAADLQTPDPTPSAAVLKAPRRCSTKCLTDPVRRSARLASRGTNASVDAPLGFAKECDKKQKPRQSRSRGLAPLLAEAIEEVSVQREEVKECPRRSLRLMGCTKALENAEVVENDGIAGKVRRGRSGNSEIGESEQMKKMRAEKHCDAKRDIKEQKASVQKACLVAKPPPHCSKKVPNLERRQRSTRRMGPSKALEKAECHENKGMEVGVHTQLKRVSGDRNGNIGTGKSEERKMNIEKSSLDNTEREKKKVEECTGFEEWTKEQQDALDRAYFVSKPSPHFWKKVSKMVPGKSAQECFERVNSSLETPPPHQPRSRIGKPVSPITSFNLLGNKRKLSTRRRTQVAQKTVRHILNKHHLADQSQEADYFAVLQNSSDIPEIPSPEIPKVMPKNPILLQKCSQKIMPSSLDPSPMVLKKIKNMALHEKYLERLHLRDARRNAVKTAHASVAKDSEIKNVALKAAKAALMSEARNAITGFEQMQANAGMDDDDHEFNDDDENLSDAD